MTYFKSNHYNHHVFLYVIILVLISSLSNLSSVSSFHHHKSNVFSARFQNSFFTTKKSMLLQAFTEIPAGEFEKVVIQSPVPVVVDFSANWCGPCKLMLPIFKALAEEYSEDSVKLVKVDTDVHEEAVERYNIQGVPLFGVFKNGEMIASHSGALTKEKLKEFINKNIQISV